GVLSFVARGPASLADSSGAGVVPRPFARLGFLTMVGFEGSPGRYRLMKCPACDSTRVFPSRLRNVIERLRQSLTNNQPYRCHECGWRQWSDVLVPTHNTDAHH